MVTVKKGYVGMAGPGKLTGRAGVSNKKGQEVMVSVDLHAKRRSASVGIRRSAGGRERENSAHRAPLQKASVGQNKKVKAVNGIRK